MAVSRAAVLQSLVLDESLHQYQSAAVNTVQNMASTFTNIAHALQKQKVQSTQFEQTLQKQINALIMTINEQASVIEDLKSTQEVWADRFGLFTNGNPDKNKHSVAARLARIEHYLSMSEPGEGDDSSFLNEYNQHMNQLNNSHNPSYPNPPQSRGHQGTNVNDNVSVSVNEDSINGHSISENSNSFNSGDQDGVSLPHIARGSINNHSNNRKMSVDNPEFSQNQQQQQQQQQQQPQVIHQHNNYYNTTTQQHNHPTQQQQPQQPQGAQDTVNNNNFQFYNNLPNVQQQQQQQQRPIAYPSNTVTQAENNAFIANNVSNSNSHPNISGRPLPLPARLQALESKLSEIEGYLGTRTGSTYEARLERILAETEPGALEKREVLERRLDEQEKQLQQCGKDVYAQHTVLVNVNDQLSQLQQKLTLSAESANNKYGDIDKNITDLATKTNQSTQELHERITTLQESIQQQLLNQSEAHSKLSQAVEGKADVRLVLDKVSRQEWLAQIRRLQQATEDLSAKSLGKVEYKQHMEQLRDTMVEDQTTRQRNIARLANELQKVVQDLANKASKADLIDVANVLSAFPQVHRELDHLKMFVDQEIASKQDLHLLQENVVSQKQLRRHTERLLKAIGDEMHKDPALLASMGGGSNMASGVVGMGSTGPLSTVANTTSTIMTTGVCDVCTRKTTLYNGSTCNVCLLKMKSKTIGPNTTKGGGFAVVTPRRNEKLYVNYNITRNKTGSLTAPQPTQLPYTGEDDMSPPPPNTVSKPQPMTQRKAMTAVLSGASNNDNDNHFSNTQPHATDGNVYASAVVKQQVGSDGKIYTSTGTRTHKMVIKK